MKENQDNQIESELEEIILEETNESKYKKIGKEINLSIFNYNNNKLEKYKLLNGEEDLLLCKEEVLNEIKSKKENKEADIKIKELYKEEEENNSIYYLNKNELKKKYLKIQENLNEDNEERNSIINNKNEQEMEKLYKESQLKHPRKINDGEIRKYTFFSWSGFFCCNKRDYLDLGQAYITYFNTVKLLIIFFTILALIHIGLMNFCSNFTSVFNFHDDGLLKTTLGNTFYRYFNTTYFTFEKNKSYYYDYDYGYYNDYYYDLVITLDCGENILDEFIVAIRHYEIDQDNLVKIQGGRIENEFFVKNNGTILDMDYIHRSLRRNFSRKYDEKKIMKILSTTDIDIRFYNYNHESKSNNYSEKIHYLYKNYSENFIYYTTYVCDYDTRRCKDYYYYYDNYTDIFYYTCIPNNTRTVSYKNNYYDYDLKDILKLTSFFSLIIIIIFYFVYKKGISRDKKEFQKNKIFINYYTLVLHKLKINSDDFEQEMNDLISFLNDILKNYKQLFTSSDIKNKEEITDLNIFDISLSNVNENKIELFEKIQSLENKIDDIQNDNDTIKDKLKNNLRGFYQSMQDIIVNKDADEKEEIQDDSNKDKISPEFEEGYNMEKQIKLGQTKTLKNEIASKIITDIMELHKEYKLNNYVDIFITFRNQKIPIFIYDIYNRRKIVRFFYYLFCQGKKLKKYYYKNQWLNFNLAKENPSDIKWENFYISTKKKCGRRFLSILISFIFVILVTLIMIVLKIEENNLNSILVVILTQGISLGSSYILNKFTKYEKYNSKSKEIFSDIKKYYWLNLLVSIAIFFKEDNYFVMSYTDMENFYRLNRIIIINMFYSIFTSQLSPLFSYILNLLKRFLDSKFDNGKTTKLNDKIKYEKLYIGPDFPFEERYAKILVNLSICLYFGTNSPVIFFFFVLFLIATFLVDKYLMINYYKIPPFYGSIISKKITSYFFFTVFLYIYGLSYIISNPYFFNNKLLERGLRPDYYHDSDTDDIFSTINFIINPINLFYHFYCEIKEYYYYGDMFFYNFNSDVLLIHFIIFLVVFVNPTTFLQKKLTPKAKFLSFLNISTVEIGDIYSVEILQKYYEIKKLQLFNLIIDCDYKNKNIDDYSHLINNYICALTYIKQNIDIKKNKQENIIEIQHEFIEDDIVPLKQEDIVRGSHLQIAGDISYNQSFIPKYEIYNNFSLVKNL